MKLALLDFALGSLRRRWGKSLALGVGLAFVVALFGSTIALNEALAAEYQRTVSALPDLTVQRLIAGRPALIDVALADQLHLPAVRSVRPRVWGYVYFIAIEANVTIVGIDSREIEGALEGRAPAHADEVAVGALLADRLGLRVGDELALPVSGDVVLSRVVGVFRTESAVRSADLIVTTTAHARTLLGMPPDQATDLAIDLTTADEAGVITAAIGDAIPGARVLDRRLLARTYELTFDSRAGLIAALLLPALAAFLLLAWERLTGLGEAERREVGVLKAIGWSTSDVLAARAWESVLIAFFGTLAGIVIAYSYVFFLGAPGLYGALLGWSTLYPPLDLAPAIDAGEVVLVVASVVVPFVALSLVPAWRAAMIDPDRAMRGEP